MHISEQPINDDIDIEAKIAMYVNKRKKLKKKLIRIDNRINKIYEHIDNINNIIKK